MTYINPIKNTFSIMLDYFLGTYGGGILKPFRNNALFVIFRDLNTLKGKIIKEISSEIPNSHVNSS